jgi:glycosyltransferase involved in cell wall biosynthesis
VAIEAEKWATALRRLGFATVTVAGDGPVDRLLPGLAIGADEPPTPAEVESALADADLVVVENLCSLPLNPPAAGVVAGALAGRPALLHHHDLPWQRPHFARCPPPPDDPRWRHVTINELSRVQLAAHGIAATTIYNAFDVDGPAHGSDPASARLRVRRHLGVDDDQLVVLQPTRALPRKNVAGGIRAAAQLDALYWLLGPAEDGFGPELDTLVADAPCPVVLGPPDGGTAMVDAYAACDVVALPSTWEGFGNPSVESAVHRRPLIIGPYPVAGELASFGFDWFGLDQIDRLRSWLDHPDPALLDANLAVARAHFSTRDLPGRIAAALPAW